MNSQRSSQKSTKEIAREAVENEFRQKKRGGGGRRGGVRGGARDYESDSGSDNDGNNDALNKRRRLHEEEGNGQDATNNKSNEPEWKRRRREKKGDSVPEYRDRARERREGKNLDYLDDTTNATTTTGGGNNDEYAEDRKRQAELSKFLGGTEEHTHLVKGLDYALAQKVRREEMGRSTTERVNEDDEDLDQLLEDSYIKNKKPSSTSSSMATIQPKSELGKSVLNYLLQHQKQQNNNPTATSSSASVSTTLATSIQSQNKIIINKTKQKSIQRSSYTFSLDSNPQKRSNAWDVPPFKVGALGGDEQAFFERKEITPLDNHLIATIKKKLDDVNDGKKKRKGLGGEGERQTSCNGAYKQKQQPQHKELSFDDKEDSSKIQSTQYHEDRQPNDTKPSSSSLPEGDDSSDDDIFADVGAYVPPTATTTTTLDNPDATVPTTTAAATQSSADANATTTSKKQSIFDNLITTDAQSTSTTKTSHNQLHQLHQKQQPQKHNESRNVIDRDVFGGNDRQKQEVDSHQAMKRRGPQTAAMEGVSMINYQGGYGEEMDVDFLNVDDDDDEYRRKKKRDVDDDDDGGENVGAKNEDDEVNEEDD